MLNFRAAVGFLIITSSFFYKTDKASFSKNSKALIVKFELFQTNLGIFFLMSFF